jgi:hypothetical protein
MDVKADGRQEVQLHAYLTLALDECEWSALCTSHLTLRKEPPVPIGDKTGWASEPVWTL